MVILRMCVKASADGFRMITSEEFTRPLSSPSPSRPTRRSRHRPSVLANIHALLLTQVFQRLQFVASSAQALKVVVIIAATIGKSDDVIKLRRNGGSATHTDWRGRQQAMPQPLQRSTSDALYSLHAMLSEDAKRPRPDFSVGLLGAHLSPLKILQ